MMDWLVCAEVPDEYVPMMLEEMELDGRDARVTALDRATPTRAPTSRSSSSAAGIPGLLAAIRLQQAGIPYTVIEKNAGVGGTWWENSYPGARVDVGNHFYCYSFEPARPLDRVFRAAAGVAGVLRGRHGPARRRPNMSGSTPRSLGAEWDDATATWTVRDPRRATAHEDG